MRDISTLHRHLDAKMKVWGIEAPDLLTSLSIFAVMSIIFSDTFLEIPMVLGLPIFVLSILVFTKRDKPEGFLKHFVSFYTTKGFFEANRNEKQYD
jgi:hypothetical protein